jgi:hypothetical protein
MTELLSVVADRLEVERIWKGLASLSPHSYFLSWGWIENWLDSLPPASNLRLAVVERGGAPVAAAFWGYGKIIRQGLFRSMAYLLNQTGDRWLDQFYIENNSFLCVPDLDPGWTALLDLFPDPWEEIYLSGLDASRPPACWLRAVPAPYCVFLANRIPAPYVDLRMLVHRGGNYLAAIGSNTRSQIRRSYRLYGMVETEVARDRSTALGIYEEMINLHRRWWERRGRPGAFASGYFVELHRSLIQRRFDSGELQLIRVHTRGSTIGCLYNFDYGGAVSFYQSGLRLERDNRLKPGYICHAEAIRHSLAQGRDVYDFMASFDDYKLRLATHKRELLWVRIQKPKLKFVAERLLRGAALWACRRYRQMRSRRKRALPLEAVPPARGV